MDEDRKIRFLIAPMLFFASIVWAVACDPNSKFSALIPGLTISLDHWTQALGFLAGGGIVIFAVGVVIGTISHALLRIGFWLYGRVGRGSTTHEISLDATTLELMWHKLKVSGTPDSSKQLFVGVTFDHDVLLKKHEGVHRWIVRRWNAFSIAVISITGLLLSLVVMSGLLEVTLNEKWWWVVLIAFLSFLVVAILAWRDTMGMLRFQAQRESIGAD